MSPEKSDCHLTAEDEGHRPREQPEDDHCAPDEFNKARNAEDRPERNCMTAHTSEHSEDFLQTVADKQETRNNSQDREDIRFW